MSMLKRVKSLLRPLTAWTHADLWKLDCRLMYDNNVALGAFFSAEVLTQTVATERTAGLGLSFNLFSLLSSGTCCSESHAGLYGSGGKGSRSMGACNIPGDSSKARHSKRTSVYV